MKPVKHTTNNRSCRSKKVNLPSDADTPEVFNKMITIKEIKISVVNKKPKKTLR